MTSDIVENNTVDLTAEYEALIERFEVSVKSLGSPKVELQERGGNVLFNSDWHTNDFEIYLAVYSGIRTHGDNPSHVAGLTITWVNAEEASQPFIKQYENYVNSLSLEVIDLSRSEWFCVNDTTRHDCGAVNKRFSERALRESKHFEPPSHLKSYMLDNGFDFAICPTQKENIFYVFSHTSGALIDKDQAINSHCENCLPAKGRGHMHLSVEGITVYTEHSSKKLESLIERIESICQIEIVKRASYDC